MHIESLEPRCLFAAAPLSFSDVAVNEFEKSLKQVNSEINAYEHQVTWRLDHHSQITGPNGISESNGTVVTSATGGAELTYKSASNVLTSQLGLQVVGTSGLAYLSFAIGTPLSAAASDFNYLSSSTGVVATASGGTLEFNPATSGAKQPLTVSAFVGTFNTTVSTPQGALAETVANGFMTIEDSLSSDWTLPNVVLSSAQLATITQQRQALVTEQARFQKFAASRYASDQAKR